MQELAGIDGFWKKVNNQKHRKCYNFGSIIKFTIGCEPQDLFSDVKAKLLYYTLNFEMLGGFIGGKGSRFSQMLQIVLSKRGCSGILISFKLQRPSCFIYQWCHHCAYSFDTLYSAVTSRFSILLAKILAGWSCFRIQLQETGSEITFLVYSFELFFGSCTAFQCLKLALDTGKL